MKRTLAVCGMVTLAFTMILAATPAFAQSWEGWGEGWAETWTETTLFQGQKAMKNGFSSFQSAEQAGDLSLGGEGGYRSHNPDDVKIEVKGGYSTGYKQYQKTPGGYQAQWGEQWAKGKVKIQSPE